MFKSSKLSLQHFIYFLLLIIFCLFRFQESVFRTEYTAAMSPDGYCSVGGFQIFIDQMHETSKFIFNDTFRTEKIGSGIGEPNPFSVFWKFYFLVLSNFFDSFDINVYSVFIIALLNGFLFYIFTFKFTKNTHLGFLGAVLTITLYNYHIRINGHLMGLGSIFFPILLIMSILKLTQIINLKNILLFSFASVLTFNMNEYYGFFGYWISLIVILCIVLSDLYSKRLNTPQLIKYSATAIVLQIILLLLLYPTILREKLINKLAHFDTTYIKGIAHPVDTMLHYSVKSLKEVFTFNPYFKADKSVFENFELTYMVGIMIFIFIIINLILIYKKTDRLEKRIINASIIILLTSLMLCLHPDYFPSLVRINAKLAPMFRVTYRSLVYFDIISLFLFLYSLFLLNKYTDASKKYVLKSYLCLSVALVLIDLPYPNIFTKVATQKFPNSESLRFLKDDPADYKVVEIPFYPFTNSTPEKNYLYIYNYYFHRKSILNFPFADSNNHKFIENIDSFAKKMNAFNDESFKILNDLGVKIIIFNKKTKADVSEKPFLAHPNLKKIYEDEDRSIYKINRELPGYNTKNIVFDFLLPKDKFFDYSSSCIEGENDYFNCSHTAKIRFFNYLTKPVKIAATFEANQSDKHISKDIEFEIPAQEYHELKVDDLIRDHLDINANVQVKAILKNMERLPENGYN